MHAYRMYRLPLALTNVVHTYIYIYIYVLRATYEYVVKHIYHSLSCAKCLSLVLSVTRNFFWPNPFVNVS